MATTQPARPVSPSVPPDGDTDDVWSWVAEELGLGWDLLLGLVLPLLLVATVGLAITVWLWRRSGRAPSSSTGADIFPGHVVTLRSADGTRGQAYVEGGWWSVRSTGSELTAGEDVRVRSVDRLELLVEPLDAEEDQPEEES